LAKQQNDTAACGGIGCFKTQCGTDGSFSPKQSWGSTGPCWCVDQQSGNQLGAKSACTPDFSCEGVSACLVRKQADMVACGGSPGCYVTQCNADGSFSPMQRRMDQCWCVDKLGVEVNSTRTRNIECSLDICGARASMGPHMSAGRVILGIFLHVLLGIVILMPALASAYRLTILLTLGKAIMSLLILPGIWWMLATSFAIPLHHQHQYLGACKAISVSIKVVHAHFCNILGFVLLLALIQVLGFLCLILGLLYTAPLAFVALCYCYHDLIGINPVAIAEGPDSLHL